MKLSTSEAPDHSFRAPHVMSEKQMNEKLKPIRYEDTFFQQLSEEIRSSQDQTTEALTDLIKSNQQSERVNRKIALWTLAIAVFTLIATVLGIAINLLE